MSKDADIMRWIWLCIQRSMEQVNYRLGTSFFIQVLVQLTFFIWVLIMVVVEVTVQRRKNCFPSWLNYMEFSCFMIVLNNNKIIAVTCMEWMRTALFLDDPGIFWYLSRNIIFPLMINKFYTQTLLETGLNPNKLQQECNCL